MPISGPTSYMSTTEFFLAHWLACDTSLGVGNEIRVTGGVGRLALQALLDTLGLKRTEVQSDLIDQEIAREEVEIRKAGLLLRINQFNERIRGAFSGSKWIRVLPLVPNISDAQSKFTDPLDSAARLWLRINNDDPMLPAVTLQGGYTQATFVADIAALKAAYTILNAAVVDAKISLEGRNDLQDQIYPVLKDYRSTMPTHFTKGHALIDSLPDLTPAPGSTPDAVTANGAWVPASSMARLTWTPSSHANLFRYEIRFCAGPDYSTDNESVVGSVLPGDPLEFLTAAGLTLPGNVASFKVYVITTTGNEKGSNTVVIARLAV